VSPNSGLYLGIDTATPYLALALWSPEGTRASFVVEVGRDHAKRLLLELDRLMTEAKLRRAALRGLAVGIGPGSYTGLRVGIASAKGLARGLGLPLGGVSTLEAMASGLKEGERAVVTLDAGRGNVYAAAFEGKGERVRALGEVAKVARGELGERYGELPVLEGRPPDPVYIAARAASALTPVRALYL
jgi:tRNA threonylcarbamoyladenosine biosynthesis protein TsaB